MKLGIVFAGITFFCWTSFAVDMSERTKVLNDIRGTFGVVPTFMREFPAEGLSGAWEDFKAVELNPNSALDSKTKELIGIAVSSSIPCRYCTYFHKKTATLNGAKTEEIKLAIAVASLERKWSTVFEGGQRDLPKFKTEIDKIVSFTHSGAAPQPDVMAMHPMDAKSTYKDMQNVMGIAPDFIKGYPEAGIAGAWNEYKDLRFNARTVLPAKVKDLIALAVASQIPSQYNIYASTEFAKSDGASAQEMNEAIAVASTVRHWSTYLNGLRQDDKEFEHEVDQIIKHLEKGRVVTPKKVSQNQDE
ncbi:MAG: carboxymuconolactone decarboxylase family protein [Pseudobdellovibrionaceae bacterium]